MAIWDEVHLGVTEVPAAMNWMIPREAMHRWDVCYAEMVASALLLRVILRKIEILLASRDMYERRHDILASKKPCCSIDNCDVRVK